MLERLLVIALGGAVGAVLRYLGSEATYRILGRGFPYGTLAVNVVGSFCIGYLFAGFTERFSVGALWHAALFAGLLGGFTTFSAFSLDTMQMIQSGQIGKALLNIVLSVGFCLAGAWGGMTVAKVY
ncbi:MAG: fluoride efflux transporter CrcB [Gammaproteobacteria bacterium]|nr:fluoride efflux transporter CrcB [Gammaproteobacteria bacterium]MDH3465552.1 fluoride efflux transporter CrcB [Gammaproteobacteria bacterium]